MEKTYLNTSQGSTHPKLTSDELVLLKSITVMVGEPQTLDDCHWDTIVELWNKHIQAHPYSLKELQSAYFSYHLDQIPFKSLIDRKVATIEAPVLPSEERQLLVSILALPSTHQDDGNINWEVAYKLWQMHPKLSTYNLETLKLAHQALVPPALAHQSF